MMSRPHHLSLTNPEAPAFNRGLAWIRNRIAHYIQEWKQPTRFDWQATLAILIGTLLLFPLMSRLPNLGWEWYYFDLGGWDATYPPWMPLSIKPLTSWDWRDGLALLTGLLWMAAAVGAAREARGRGRASMVGVALLAITTAPVLMLTWLGNVATVTLFGLIALPFGIPFATVQPHLAPWALLARRSWTVWGLVFLALSFVVWGWWPPLVLNSMGGAYEHPIAMGWSILGWPVLAVGVVLLLFTNADPLRLMAAGTFITPYLMPVHLVLLVPALGRARGWARLLLWGTAWLTLAPPMFGPAVWSKYLAMLFPLAVWWLLRPQKVEPAAT